MIYQQNPNKVKQDEIRSVNEIFDEIKENDVVINNLLLELKEILK